MFLRYERQGMVRLLNLAHVEEVCYSPEDGEGVLTIMVHSPDPERYANSVTFMGDEAHHAARALCAYPGPPLIVNPEREAYDEQR